MGQSEYEDEAEKELKKEPAALPDETTTPAAPASKEVADGGK